MAGRLMEEYFEGGEGEGFGEEEEVVDLADFDADAVDIMGDVVEHDEELEWRYFDEGEEPPVGKEHSLDPDTITLEGNGLLGEVVEFDQYDRREASCGANQGEVKLIMRTDNYGYETAWKIVNQNNGKTIARGPPRGTNYADKSTYSGRWCLPPGRYRAVVEDRGRDGMCTGNPQIFGCGFFKVYLNGNPAGQIVNDKSRWVNKGFPINVAPVASRIDGVGTQPQGEQWCRKVRSVMKVPQGTCTTPDGRRGHRVRVLTKVDKYGKETQWTIKRNGVTKMKMGPVIEANKQLSVQECLAPGTYEVKFTDMDGICCRHGEGFFKVFVDGKELITGGSFTSSISHGLRLDIEYERARLRMVVGPRLPSSRLAHPLLRGKVLQQDLQAPQVEPAAEARCAGLREHPPRLVRFNGHPARQDRSGGEPGEEQGYRTVGTAAPTVRYPC